METSVSVESALRPDQIIRFEETWSARRAKHMPDEKKLMAEYCARHDFLVRENSNPETDLRETVASILVNQGTTPDIVVKEALRWIENHQDRGPFHITWYTPGNLVPGTLRSFRQNHQHLSAATQLFLFPGRVDQQTESVSGPEAEAFAQRLERRFTYAFLSAHSFDIHTGIVYFHLPEETRLQQACATRYAAHKFLFLDSSKFKSEGEIGYRIDELLRESEAVTIYTVSSDKDEWIKVKFAALCNSILDIRGDQNTNGSSKAADKLDMKFLRLRIVGKETTPTDSMQHQGFLRVNELPENHSSV